MIRTNLTTNPTFQDGTTGWNSTEAASSASISLSKRAGTTVTITTTAAHGARVGYTITVAGTNGNPSIEGTYVITSVSAVDKLTYTTAASGTITEAADTGTVTFSNIQVNSTTGLFGDYSLIVNKKAAANSGTYSNASAAVTVGLTYVASAYINVPTGEATGDFKVGIAFFDVSNVLVGSIQYSSTTSVAASASSWTRVYKTYVAPATSTYAKVYIVQSTSGTANKIFLVDGVQFENSYDPTPFIDPLLQQQEKKKVDDALRKVPVPHITGMELNADIMLNGQLFNTIDEDDCVWVCTDIQGWWDLPDSEIPELTRGLDDGSYDVRGRWATRNMTFTGSIIVPNRDLVPTVREKLVTALSLVHSGGWLYVGETDNTTAAYVRLSGRPDIRVVNPRGRIDFSVGLKSANPVKFKWNWNDANGYVSTTVAADGSASITNEGNIAVPTLLRLTGPVTAPILVGNSTDGTLLRIVKSLRSATYSKNITQSQQTGNTVVLTFASHEFNVGDIITISGISTSGRTGLNESGRVITDTSLSTITYESATTATLATLATNGAAALTAADVLVIDTYNKSATLNGLAVVARSFIDTLVDWISLSPGANTITYDPTAGSTTLTVQHRSGWIG
jgi:hypothetical protein